MYRIVGNFQGRKLSQLVKSDHLAVGENFHGILKPIVDGMVHHPNFMEKTFAGGSKTTEFVNVFSLESFRY